MGKIFDIITDFLNFRKQRLVLNGQYFLWTIIKARVHQGSILEPLLFLIDISDLSNDLTTHVKLFADVASLLSILHDMNTYTINLKYNLKSKTVQFSGKETLTAIPINRLRK